MFSTAKELPVSLNAFPLWQMHATVRASHHIIDHRLVVPGCIFSIRPDQQVNRSHNGNQK
jgi:hypothetical protein